MAENALSVSEIHLLYSGGQAMKSALPNDSELWPVEATVGEVVYPPGGVFGPRLQPFMQLVMVHTGSMGVWIDGQLQYAGSNTVAILYPGHEERFAFAEDCETWHSWMHATIAHLDEALLARFKRLPWPLQLSPTMSQLTRDALALRTSSLPTARPLIKSLAAQMLWRYLGEGELSLSLAADANPIVEQARQFIHSHLEEPLTLDIIANAVSISAQHLIRRFQAQLHTTPMSYVWEQRVKKGIELLEQTGLSVGTIAQRCGFQTSYHFSRRIHQATGCSPLEVRRRSWQQ